MPPLPLVVGGLYQFELRGFDHFGLEVNELRFSFAGIWP